MKTAILFLAASALALPTAQDAHHKRAAVLTKQSYAQFQVSDGVAGNALAEVQAKFPVSTTHLPRTWSLQPPRPQKTRSRSHTLPFLDRRERPRKRRPCRRGHHLGRQDDGRGRRGQRGRLQRRHRRRQRHRRRRPAGRQDQEQGPEAEARGPRPLDRPGPERQGQLRQDRRRAEEARHQHRHRQEVGRPSEPVGQLHR